MYHVKWGMGSGKAPTRSALELVKGENGPETNSFSNFLSVCSCALAWCFDKLLIFIDIVRLFYKAQKAVSVWGY